KPHWVTDAASMPWPPDVRRDLRRLGEPDPELKGDELAHERWLDTMTYEDYLTKVRGLHPQVPRFLDAEVAAEAGLGCDAISACLPRRGNRYIESRVSAVHRVFGNQASRTPGRFSFPGGNDGIMRAIVKWLNPEVIEGSKTFADVHNR